MYCAKKWNSSKKSSLIPTLGNRTNVLFINYSAAFNWYQQQKFDCSRSAAAAAVAVRRSSSRVSDEKKIECWRRRRRRSALSLCAAMFRRLIVDSNWFATKKIASKEVLVSCTQSFVCSAAVSCDGSSNKAANDSNRQPNGGDIFCYRLPTSIFIHAVHRIGWMVVHEATNWRVLYNFIHTT